MVENSIAAMIIEYPVVPLGASRFRLQVMASHTAEQAIEAASVMSRVLSEVSRGEDLVMIPETQKNMSRDRLTFSSLAVAEA